MYEPVVKLLGTLLCYDPSIRFQRKRVNAMCKAVHCSGMNIILLLQCTDVLRISPRVTYEKYKTRNICFYSTSCLWNELPPYTFHATYNLSSFGNNVYTLITRSLIICFGHLSL